MATDGVKIIDGDTAFDIYHEFTEMYNSGATIDELKKRYEISKKSCSYEATEYEICVTAYALAFWEIGKLTDDMLAEVKTVMERKAGVEDWVEQCGTAAGKARQRELDKLLAKISVPKVRPKKRTPPPKPTLTAEEEQIIDEAENHKWHSEYAEAIALYKKLLAEKPNLHDVRYKYIELLCYIPKQEKDFPDLKHDNYFNQEKYTQYQKYIRERTDWVEIEEQCKYMLAHRDTDRMQATKRKINKISEWYDFVAYRLINALLAQGKCEEAAQILDEYIKFGLSRSNTEFSWFMNDFGNLYQCYLMLHDDEKAAAYREKCKAEWTRNKIDVGGWDWDRHFVKWEERLSEEVEKYGGMQLVL